MIRRTLAAAGMALVAAAGLSGGIGAGLALGHARPRAVPSDRRSAAWVPACCRCRSRASSVSHRHHSPYGTLILSELLTLPRLGFTMGPWQQRSNAGLSARAPTLSRIRTARGPYWSDGNGYRLSGPPVWPLITRATSTCRCSGFRGALPDLPPIPWTTALSASPKRGPRASVRGLFASWPYSRL
jgi:hypothetical protein